MRSLECAAASWRRLQPRHDEVSLDELSLRSAQQYGEHDVNGHEAVLTGSDPHPAGIPVWTRAGSVARLDWLSTNVVCTSEQACGVQLAGIESAYIQFR